MGASAHFIKFPFLFGNYLSPIMAPGLHLNGATKLNDRLTAGFTAQSRFIKRGVNQE